MEKNSSIYNDIAKRTNGDVYSGVVGPVRSGKSTFIKKFMELAVIPNMSDEYEKSRTTDELPQSGEGKIIMTTEPKFVPKYTSPFVLAPIFFNNSLVFILFLLNIIISIYVDIYKFIHKKTSV